MDFELNEDQQAILEAVQRLLEQYAGPARAITLFNEQGYDHELDQALFEAGFMGICHDVGSLEAALVVEAIAGHAGVSSATTELLIAASINNKTINGPIAVAVQTDKPVPVRYLAHAKQQIGRAHV